VPFARSASDRCYSSTAEPALLLYRLGARRGSVVVDCSPELAGCGVLAGMPLAEAQSLIHRACHGFALRRTRVGETTQVRHPAEPVAPHPHPSGATAGLSSSALSILEHDPTADRRALEQLAQWCHRFSPTVMLAEGMGERRQETGDRVRSRELRVQREARVHDAIWLEATGLAHLYGGEERMLHTLFREFRAAGWTVHLAMADSHAAAWALARFRASAARPLSTPPGSAAEMMANIPVEALQLSESATETLLALGLSELGQLERLPRAGLASRFGPEVIKQLDRLFCRRVEVLPAVKHCEPREAAFTFDAPLSDHDILLHVLAELFAELARRLVAERLGATWIRVNLDCSPAAPCQIDLRLFCPSAQAKHWLELATLQLERTRLSAAVSATCVRIEAVAPLEARQRELFSSGSRSHEHERLIGTLVDRLRSRLGHDALARVVLVPEALPERSYRILPTTGNRQRLRHAIAAAAGGALARPLALVAPGRPLRLTSGFDGAPASFHWGGTWHRVTRTWGPERIESGWWRGRLVRRDYYRVETEEGGQAWLFRRLDNGQWFLQGWFA